MNDVLADRYLLESELARGAAGVVHRASDLATGDDVAVKVLHAEAAAEPTIASAFLDEAAVLSELSHPGIVRPRDLIVDGDLMALVMDLVEGVDMRRALLDDGPLAPPRALAVVSEVAEALTVVHAKGIVHGDIKPGNILVPAEGGSACLVDFGVARRVAGPDAPTHATPDYTAPEVVEGQASSAKSDVYGLGLVLYEVLCGTSPYRGGTIDEVLRRQVVSVPERPAAIPGELWNVIEACLHHDPAQRPEAESLPPRLRAVANLVGNRPHPRQAPQLRERTKSDGAPPMALPGIVSSGPQPAKLPLAVPGAAPSAALPSRRASYRTKPAALVTAVAGFMALVVGGMLLLSAMSTSEGTVDNPPQAENTSSDNDSTEEESVEDSKPESTDPSPSTDDQSEEPSSESSPDSGTDGDSDNGSGSGESDTDLPGEDHIGSPLPGNPGGS